MANFNTANTGGINFQAIYAPPSSESGTLTPYVEDIGFALGQHVFGSNNSEYVFCQADEAITGGMAIAVSEVFQANKLTAALAATGQFIAVAPATDVADTYYFWAQRNGSGGQLLGAPSVAADIALWTTGTAGLLDDVSGTSQVRIDGISVVTANALTVNALVDTIVQWPRSASV